MYPWKKAPQQGLFVVAIPSPSHFSLIHQCVFSTDFNDSSSNYRSWCEEIGARKRAIVPTCRTSQVQGTEREASERECRESGHAHDKQRAMYVCDASKQNLPGCCTRTSRLLLLLSLSPATIPDIHTHSSRRATAAQNEPAPVTFWFFPRDPRWCFLSEPTETRLRTSGE